MEDDLDALAPGVPAGDDAFTSPDDGLEPETVEPTTGDPDESDDAGEPAGDGDEPEQPEPEDEEKPEPRKKPSGSERARRRIEALEAELAAVKATREAPRAAEGAPRDVASRIVAEIGEAPKESDFAGDFMAFERAQTVYDTQKAIVARELKRADAADAERSEQAKKASQTSEQARMVELFEDHKERLDAIEKRLPGSKAKISAAAGLQIAGHVIPLVLESEKSALLTLHFAEHPDKLADLNRMSPVAAARELGGLEARLSIPKPKLATNAQPPVTPPKGRATPPSDPSKMSMADYAAWRARKS